MLRPLEIDDVPAVVDLANAGAGAAGRRAVVDASGRVRLCRYVPPPTEQMVAVDGSGAVVGYAYLANRDGLVVQETGGAVRPDRWQRGVGSVLLDWAVARASERARALTADVRGVLRTMAFEDERRALALFGRRGFVHVRTWMHMAVELTEPPAPAPLPAPPPPARRLTIRAMDLAADWEQVGPAMDEGYADHWGTVPPSFVQEPPPTPDGGPLDGPGADDSYDNTLGLCFVALADDTVVAGLLANGKVVEQANTGRIGSLFVRPAYRRHGIGRALMATAIAEFWRRGIRRVILDTDADNPTGAPSLYQRLGMRAYRHELVLEREVRPGREVRVTPPRRHGTSDTEPSSGLASGNDER